MAEPRFISMRRALYGLLSLALGLAFIVWIVCSVPQDELLVVIYTVSPFQLAALMFLGAIPALFLEPDRISRFLAVMRISASRRELCKVCYPVNTLSLIAPFQSGEWLKARLLNASWPLSTVSALGLLVAEKGFLLLATMAWVLLPSLLRLHVVGGLVLWLGILFILAPFILSRVLPRLAGNAHLPQSIGEALLFFRNLSNLNTLMLIVVSLLNQLFDILLFSLSLLAVGADIPILVSTEVVMLAVLLSKLPLTPAGLGVREGGLVLGLSGYAPAPMLVGASLLFGAIKFWIPCLITAGYVTALQTALKQVANDMKLLWDQWRVSRRTKESG